MKNEKIREFLTRLAQEEGFKDEFLKLKEKVEKKGFSKKDNEKFISECLLPWSKKLGYKLTKKDFIDFDRTQKPTEITGLTTEQLENVSGGGFTMLLALFATFGSALAGFAGGGGTTGNNAKTNDNFGSTDLTFSYSSSAHPSSGDVDLASYKQTGIDSIDYYNSNDGKTSADFDLAAGEIGEPQPQPQPQPASGEVFDSNYDWTADQDYLSSSQWTEGTTNTSEADFNNPFAGHEPIFEQDALLHSAPTAAPGSTGIASMDYYEANYGETPADFATGTAEGAGTTTPTAAPGSTGIASMDYYEANYGETPADFGSGAGKPMSTAIVTTPGQPQTSVSDYNENFARSSAAVDSGENVVQMLKNIREGASAPADGKPMSTALVATPGHPQTSVKNYNEHFARSSVPAASGSDIASISAHQAQPTPASAAFSPINLSTRKDLPEQSGSAGEEYAQTDAKAPKGPTGIASVDNYLVGEGEILSDGGQTPVDFENPKNASVEQVQTESEVLDDLNPFALNQNMFSHSSTPLVTTSEPGSQEPIPGLWDRIGNYFKSAQDLRRELYTDMQTNFDGVVGTPEEIAQHNYENYGETSAEDYDKNYARTSPGDYDQNYGRTSSAEFERHHGTTSADDYDQNYARSYRPKSHTFNMEDLSSENGVYTKSLGAPLSVPGEVSDALGASFKAAGTPQQTRLAVNVGQYGKNIGASSSILLGTAKGFDVAQPSSGTQQTRLAGDVGTGSADASAPISLDVPEGVNVSTTSSTLGGQETINMLKDIHAAENANFKAVETQSPDGGGSSQVSIYTGLDSSGNAFSAAPAGGESMSTALVTTPGQPQPSVDDYNKRFARFSAAVDSGENVVQMLNDIHVEANDGSAAGYPLSTAPETTPVQHEILQQTESAGSTIERLGLEGEISTSSGPVSGVTSGGIRWHLNTKGKTVFDRDISSAQTTTTATTGGATSGPVTTTASASTPSSTGSPSVGLLGYSQSSAGSGSVGSEQTQTAVATQDLNITTGFAGGGIPADSPVLNQINTTQGNSTFSATQNNTTSNTTSESFTSSSSQNGQSWKDFAKQAATGAAGIIAAVGVPTAIAVGLSKLPDNAVQQNNTDKTKGTSKKTEEKTSIKETKEGNDFMRLFRETLQKNSPEASQYLDSLK